MTLIPGRVQAGIHSPILPRSRIQHDDLQLVRHAVRPVEQRDEAMAERVPSSVELVCYVHIV